MIKDAPAHVTDRAQVLAPLFAAKAALMRFYAKAKTEGRIDAAILDELGGPGSPFAALPNEDEIVDMLRRGEKDLDEWAEQIAFEMLALEDPLTADRLPGHEWTLEIGADPSGANQANRHEDGLVSIIFYDRGGDWSWMVYGADDGLDEGEGARLTFAEAVAACDDCVDSAADDYRIC